MSNKEIIAIIGAGAIGRGFLPWKINTEKYDFIFVDINPNIVDAMNKNGGFLTFKSHGSKLEEKFIHSSRACLISEFKAADYKNLSAIFVAVGPNNVKMIADAVKDASCSIVLCENDPATVEILKAETGNDRIYFAVPDVIASNTASSENLLRDPLAIHTEDGILFIDERAEWLDGDIEYISADELLNKEWKAKLFLHNTPHCIAAYLGAMNGLKYLHEVMERPELCKIVVGSMNEMLDALKSENENDHSFLEWYAVKEIERFSDNLLCDPISRVAREPYRKLQPDGRLLGAAALCESSGIDCENILIGIAGAAVYAYNLEFTDSTVRSVSNEQKITHVFSKIGLDNSKINDKILSKLDFLTSGFD
ncbi:mannitol dehydrogenase family protein [Methanimicrococcus blatticola]|uniref:D-mannitol 1-phosphate 5-dehydrogenase n=1 Tax=Methanimicrococcus blatticola TaxID=91560 RepID=A0A484F5H3_9EURY|nr:2-dehydropantoate 2-reductase N-terminal domain-containing protein [Methanimicrococcus blatticola]MBZ3936004.1 hypothetical protein [Methanimicrococcus blatticola]MCC2509383.1 hypothetical protein [Methanimicrococcus blatticola]TDQ68266.1 D-mannitol 1-phosphate 5-dehydrogenase [Methanimicrococcus blatticola]